MMNWKSNRGCSCVLWTGSDEENIWKTQGDGMNEQGRDGIDGITAAILVSDHRVAMWGGSLGYRLHEVNMHDVHISKYAYMCLCKRESEYV